LKSSKPSDLTERRVSGDLVFDGTLLKVHRDLVRLPDGSQGTREYIRHPGAVAIVPLFDDGRVLLERQFRYPHGRDFIEVPAGKLEANEPHLDTAKRELLEETGYTAGEFLETMIVAFDEAIAMIRDGRITDAKTVAALLLVKDRG
jgi:ADP-ribose pyrophosphatase